MILSNVRASIGLNATATLGAAGTSGSLQLGHANQTVRLDTATSGYHLQAVFANTSDALVLDLLANDTSGSTTWVAGAAQVETATAAGTITTAGNATAIVTSAGMTGSPLTVTFAVALNDTGSQLATKARAALAANATIAARFDVSGTTTAIVLSRKPSSTFTVPGGTLPIYLASDATLNIALADGTSAGITEAATSTGTVAGTASDGVKIYDGDGLDLEGEAISITNILAVEWRHTGTSGMTVEGVSTDYGSISPGERMVKAVEAGSINFDTTQTFVSAGAASLSITVFGS